MTTTNETKQVFKSELLQNTAQMIKDAGYKVFYSVWSSESSNKKPTYFHFTDGVNIGYAEEPYFGGIKFSTVHKPCKECGTGFACNDYGDSYDSPTIKEAKEAFMYAPTWARNSERNAVKKYKSWDEYVQKNGMPKYIEF